jgi:uncharacterized protein (TIGR02246 family)
MDTALTTIVGDVFAELARAWNDGDGARYGEQFTDQAHFVNIRGTHMQGAETIAQGHQGIFDSIYRGSTVAYSVIEAERITEDCLLAMVHAELRAPSGPLQGSHEALITALLGRDGDRWKVRHFHNTLVAD